MTVSVQDKITAANFNTLQSRVQNILGTGSSSSGYGQTLNSTTVSANAVVTAEQMDKLRQDINNGRVHQTGSLTGLSDIDVKDIIAADTSGGDANKGFNDYFREVGFLEDDRFLIDVTQASVENAISSTRSVQWNGTITHRFTVTFSSANARRYFFNSGGAIQFKAQLSNGSGAKDSDWATMLSNMGTIEFTYLNTQSTGSGTGSAIGNYDLTTSFQTIFQKSGSGVYAENLYQIRARSQSNNTIDFRIDFQDNDVGEGLNPPDFAPIDEDVQYISGTLTSTIQQKRATGNYVSVASPQYTNTATL